jgi:hypothetical protein
MSCRLCEYPDGYPLDTYLGPVSEHVRGEVIGPASESISASTTDRELDALNRELMPAYSAFIRSSAECFLGERELVEAGVRTADGRYESVYHTFDEGDVLEIIAHAVDCLGGVIKPLTEIRDERVAAAEDEAEDED